MKRICTQCGGRKGKTRFENKSFVVSHAGMTRTVEGLSGWCCKTHDEVEFDPESAQRYAADGDALVLRARERQSYP